MYLQLVIFIAVFDESGHFVLYATMLGVKGMLMNLIIILSIKKQGIAYSDYAYFENNAHWHCGISNSYSRPAILEFTHSILG